MNQGEQLSGPKTRASVGVGQGLVILGLILVYGVGGYWLIGELFQDPEVPWFVKVGVPAILFGLTILFVAVLAQRMKAARSDKYTDVED